MNIVNDTRKLLRIMLLIPVIVLGLGSILATTGGSDDDDDGFDPGNPPDQPQNVALVPADAQVTISWDAASGADGYHIYWNTTGGVTDADSEIDVSGTAHVHTGLANGVTYYYRVQAYNNADSSNLSAEVNATPLASILPAPSGLSVQSRGGHVELDWDPVVGALSYDVYWNTTGAVTKADDTLNVLFPPTPTPPLTDGERYFFMIIANDATGESAPSLEISAIPGIQQLGTPQYDTGYSVAVDGSGWGYIAGFTEGDLGGANAGESDIFLAKYNLNGQIWLQQYGTAASDYGYAVAAGILQVYVAGQTFGDLDGTNAGGSDAFLTKYDTDGNLLWTRQFGTSQGDSARGVGVDGFGNAYIAGNTDGDLDGVNAGDGDVFVAKYDTDGNLQWIRQFGTSEDEEGLGVAVDYTGSIYISGQTLGDLDGTTAGGFDVFLAKYDTDGNLQWLRQFGTPSFDTARGVAVDSTGIAGGNAYLTGETSGDLGGTNAGATDAYVAKYDTDGNQQWLTQFGTSTNDYGRGVTADFFGNTYITGYTGGDLGGTNAGATDTFIASYNAAGGRQWLQQIGSADSDNGYGIAFAASVDVLYVTGETGGNLDGDLGSSSDLGDAFLYAMQP